MLSFFPQGVLDEILNLIESVSEGFPSYSFDSIQHNKLWDPLLRKSVDGKILNVFKSMYEKLKSCVKCGNGLTDYFNCTVGTRQGCVTSPIIFILFINDLVNYLREKCGNEIFESNEIEDVYFH